MAIYRRFLDGNPQYLARHYWWAYLWKPAVWFFDHQPVISAILFGHYRSLLETTLEVADKRPRIRTLQLTCVYGQLTPELMQATGQPLHLCDVAAAQLELAHRKTTGLPHTCILARMNAEQLGYRDDAFDQIVFFLFHELPPQARRRTLAEIARTIRRGGTILITEYGELPERHWLNLPPVRWLLERLEPFLNGFRQESLEMEMENALKSVGKQLAATAWEQHCFKGFYRVAKYSVDAD